MDYHEIKETVEKQVAAINNLEALMGKEGMPIEKLLELEKASQKLRFEDIPQSFSQSLVQSFSNLYPGTEVKMVDNVLIIEDKRIRLLIHLDNELWTIVECWHDIPYSDKVNQLTIRPYNSIVDTYSKYKEGNLSLFKLISKLQGTYAREHIIRGESEKPVKGLIQALYAVSKKSFHEYMKVAVENMREDDEQKRIARECEGGFEERMEAIGFQNLIDKLKDSGANIREIHRYRRCEKEKSSND